MGFLSDLVPGYPPWSPCPGATNMEEWHRYDMPLVGTFVVADETVLFVNVEHAEGVEGHLPVPDLWAYTVLTGDEELVTYSQVFTDTADMYRTVARCFEGKETVIGLEIDGAIHYWYRFPPSREELCH